MGHRTNLTLFVLAVLLTAYAFFFEAGSNPLTHRGRVFPDIDPGDIMEVLIERPSLEKDAALGLDARPIRLRREGTPPDWWIVEPIRFEAFHPRIQSIVNDLADLVRVKEVAPGEAPEAFARGVEARVSFKTRDGIGHAVEIGSEHPDARLRFAYCRSGGSGFVTGSDFRRDVLAGSLNDFRSRALVGIAPQDVAAFTVSGETRFEKRIVRDGTSDRWRFHSPLDAAADRELVEELLRSLNSWTIASFEKDAATDADFASCALSPARARLVVDRVGGGNVSLEVGREGVEATGKDEKRVFLRFSGQPFLFRADAKPLELLFARPEDLRSRYAFDLGLEDVEEIAYEASGDRTTLRRVQEKGAREHGWKVLDSGGRELFAGDRPDIDSAVSSLRRLLIHKFLPEELGPPTGKILLKTRSGRQLELLLGKPAADENLRGQNMHHAALPGEPGSYLVSTSLVESFRVGPISFRKRDISSLDPARIQELRVIDDVDVWSLARALPDDPWMLEADTPPVAGRELNGGLINKLLLSLHKDNFRVVRFAPEVVDFEQAAIELQSPRRAIILDRLDGDGPVEPRKLVLGRLLDASGEALGRVDTTGVPPFVLDKTLSQQFDALVNHLREVTGK